DLQSAPEGRLSPRWNWNSPFSVRAVLVENQTCPLQGVRYRGKRLFWLSPEEHHELPTKICNRIKRLKARLVRHDEAVDRSKLPKKAKPHRFGPPPASNTRRQARAVLSPLRRTIIEAGIIRLEKTAELLPLTNAIPRSRPYLDGASMKLLSE